MLQSSPCHGMVVERESLSSIDDRGALLIYSRITAASPKHRQALRTPAQDDQGQTHTVHTLVLPSSLSPPLPLPSLVYLPPSLSFFLAPIFLPPSLAPQGHADASLPLYSVGFYYQDFLWAVSCVMSRQNEVPLSANGKDTTLALIPLWDMSNHANGVIGTDYDLEHQNCICYATRPFKAGDEFKIFYGPRSNAELFTHQGFVYLPNKADSVKIKLGTC